MSMFKRSDDPHSSPSYPAPGDPAPPPPSRRDPSPGSRAVIGPSIRIQGDLTGEEDLVIEGRVDGKIELKQQSVTIGQSGRVKADVIARTISVEGEVRGNLLADEQVTVRRSGHVQGNITAPRVSLEDGAKFKGSIDMEPKGDARGGSVGRGVESKGPAHKGSESKGGPGASTLQPAGEPARTATGGTAEGAG